MPDSITATEIISRHSFCNKTLPRQCQPLGVVAGEDAKSLNFTAECCSFNTPVHQSIGKDFQDGVDVAFFTLALDTEKIVHICKDSENKRYPPACKHPLQVV